MDFQCYARDCHCTELGQDATRKAIIAVERKDVVTESYGIQENEYERSANSETDGAAQKVILPAEQETRASVIKVKQTDLIDAGCVSGQAIGKEVAGFLPARVGSYLVKSMPLVDSSEVFPRIGRPFEVDPGDV